MMNPRQHSVSFTTPGFQQIQEIQNRSNWSEEAENKVEALIDATQFHPHQIGIVVVFVEHQPYLGWTDFTERYPIPLLDEEVVKIVWSDGRLVEEKAFKRFSKEDIKKFGVGHYWIRNISNLTDVTSWKFTDLQLASWEKKQKDFKWLQRMQELHSKVFKDSKWKDIAFEVPVVGRLSHVTKKNVYLGFVSVAYRPVNPDMGQDRQKYSIFDQGGKKLITKKFSAFSVEEITEFITDHFWMPVE